MQATYISSNQFKVSTDKTGEFLVGRRIRALCGLEYKYSTVQFSTYSSPDTTVTIEENILISNLSEVHYGIVNIGEQGSFPNHSHNGTEGTGGELFFSNLSDTPTTYSGSDGKYLKTTSSGIDFVDDLYTKSEVDTISGTLQTNIDTKASVELFLTEGVPTSDIGKKDDVAVDYLTGIMYERFLDADDSFAGGEFTFYPSVGGDDGYTYSTTFNNSSNVLMFGDVSYTDSSTWIKFNNVNIINGATITEAYIKVIGYANKSGTYNLNVYFNDTDNGAAPTNISEFNALTLTSAIAWGGSDLWEGGVQYNSPELKTILQSIIDRSGWSSGNSVQAIIKNNNSDGAVNRQISSLENLSGTEKAELYVVCSAPVVWREKLSPDFLKLSDTPTTYSGVSGKYLKTTISGIEFVDDLYTKSEVDTISGSLQTNIDTKPDTEWFLTEGEPDEGVGKEDDIAINQNIGTIYKNLPEGSFVLTTPTTWNPSDKHASITLSNSDLTATKTSSSWGSVRSVLGVSSGKWYWENVTVVIIGSVFIGIGNSSANINFYPGVDANSYAYKAADGKKVHIDSSVVYGDTYSSGDIISVALDMDAGKIWWGKNGVWQASGDPVAGTGEAYNGISGIFFAMYGSYSNTNQITANFGVSSFSYTVPTGFTAGLGEGFVEGGWTEKLSPDFIKLSDTPTTYAGLSGQYLKTTNSGIEFVEDLYTKSEVDTISGTLQTDIDGKPDTEWFLTDGEPSSGLGKIDDVAINQNVGTIYERAFEELPVATWNPDDKTAEITLSNGNLTAKNPGVNGWKGVRGTTSRSSGKWYFEFTVNVGSGDALRLGVATNAESLGGLGDTSAGYAYRGGGQKGHSNSWTAYGSSYTVNDVVSVALDMDNGKLWWAKNGIWQASGDPTAGTNEAYSGLSGTFYAMISIWTANGEIVVNFGASAFSHAMPTGFSGWEYEDVWAEKLSPDFLKLSDTPTTYSGESGKYLKATISGIEFSDDYHFGDDTNYTQIETDGKVHFFGSAQPVNFIIMDSLSCDASHLAPLGLTSLAAADGILTSDLDTATGSSRRIEVVGIDGGVFVKGRNKGSYTQGDTTHSSHRIKIKLNTTNAVWEQSGEWKVILDILSGDIIGDFTVYMPPFSIMEYDSLEGYITVDGATYAEITPRGFDVSLAGPAAAEELFSSNETTGSGIVVEVASTAGFYVGNEVFVSDSSNSEWTRVKEIVTDTSITVDLTNSYTTTNGAKFNIFDYIKTTLTEPIQRGLFRAKVFKADKNSGIQLQMPVPQQTDPTKDLGVVLQYVSTVDNPGSSLVSKWRVQYFFKALGEDIPENYQYAELVYVDVTPPVTKCNYIATLATLTQADHQGKNLLAMEVARLGEDSGDTYTGDFKLVAIITTMPWKQLGYEA